MGPHTNIELVCSQYPMGPRTNIELVSSQYPMGPRTNIELVNSQYRLGVLWYRARHLALNINTDITQHVSNLKIIKYIYI